MNPFVAIGHFFKKIGQLVGKAIVAAGAAGLSDEILHLALGYVKSAAESQLDNDARREQVVSLLLGHGIPESICRLAVELAVRLAKSEVEKLP